MLLLLIAMPHSAYRFSVEDDRQIATHAALVLAVNLAKLWARPCLVRVFVEFQAWRTCRAWHVGRLRGIHLASPCMLN